MYLLLVLLVRLCCTHYTTEQSASLTTQGYHIGTPCLIKPPICNQVGVNTCVLRAFDRRSVGYVPQEFVVKRSFLKASRSSIVAISAGRVFHFYMGLTQQIMMIRYT